MVIFRAQDVNEDRKEYPVVLLLMATTGCNLFFVINGPPTQSTTLGVAIHNGDRYLRGVLSCTDLNIMKVEIGPGLEITENPVAVLTAPQGQDSTFLVNMDNPGDGSTREGEIPPGPLWVVVNFSKNGKPRGLSTAAFSEFPTYPLIATGIHDNLVLGQTRNIDISEFTKEGKAGCRPSTTPSR